MAIMGTVSPSQSQASSMEHAPAMNPTFAARLLGIVPTVVVFAALGTVLYFGHHNGWKIPKFSTPSATDDQQGDWCVEHLVPESQCVECNPELYPKTKPFGICKEHGVTECVIHHPELAQVKAEPRLPKYDTVQALATIPRLENNSRNMLHTRRVQFTSIDTVTKSGVDVTIVDERRMIEAVMANGELKFDPTRVAHLSPRVAGSVAVVLKTLGDQVEADELLGLVDAAQVGKAKSQFVEALIQYELKKTTKDRLKGISASGAVSGKSLIDAEAAFKEAEVALLSIRQVLANLGLPLPAEFKSDDPAKISQEIQFIGIPDHAMELIPVGLRTANLIPIRSPYPGTIVESEIVAGEIVDTTRSLFTIADPTRMWLILNVRQEDVRRIQPGLPVAFQPDDGGQEIRGTVSWISPSVDEQTRTLRVRVDVKRNAETLRDRTFGTGHIILRDEANAIVVPREALQSTTDAQFVFVRDKNFFDSESPKLFHVRQVRVGAQDGQFVELLAGVLPGEVVATKGSAMLMAQLLRSSLGAGCGCHQQ